jgi:predicted lipoprotein with Yx(FWY)xxD motif
MPAHLSPRGARPLLAVLAAALTVAVGCSSSKSTNASAGPTNSATVSTSTSSSTPTSSGSGGVVKSELTSLGPTLVDASNGRTLYHFDADKPGNIACLAGCVTLWPPLFVTGTPTGDAGGGTLGVVTRPDGGRQLTWNGLPMYRFANDKAPGDVKGDGFAGGIWHATRVAAASGSAGTSTPTTAATRSSGNGY